MSSSKPHIVHIIPTLRIGGAERLVVDICNGIVRDGYSATIVTFFYDAPLAEELCTDVMHIVSRKRGKISIGFISELKKLLQSLRPDVVHTHLFGADVWGRIVAKKLNIPVVTTEHNVNKDEGWVKHFIKRALRDRTDKYVAVSSCVSTYMQDFYKILSKDITVIHPGIDTKKFQCILRKTNDTAPRILMLGRLTHQKGFDIGLRVLSQIKDREWQCRIVGSGEDASMLQNIAKELGLIDRVIFESATRDVISEYAQADILLMPSRWEGFGMVAVEAMASGVFVVGSCIGGLEDSIKDTHTGLLADPDNLQSFVNALMWSLDNDTERLMITKKARVVSSAFDITNMIEKYKNIYSTLL